MTIGWVASSALLTPKNRRRRIPEIRVGTGQCPKLVSGTMNGIDALEFVSGVIEWRAMGRRLVESV